MSDADDLKYFTEVLKRLDALHDRATKSQDRHVANLATAASEPIGVLVGCLLEMSGSDPGGRMGRRMSNYRRRAYRTAAAADAAIRRVTRSGRTPIILDEPGVSNERIRRALCESSINVRPERPRRKRPESPK
jgi:hypothetical protein